MGGLGMSVVLRVVSYPARSSCGCGAIGREAQEDRREVSGPGCLEGRFVREAAAGSCRGRTPGVVGRGAALGTGRAEAAAGRRTALGAVHLGGRVAQRGADLVDLHLDDRALLAFARLV